jgi:hypothetical protein
MASANRSIPTEMATYAMILFRVMILIFLRLLAKVT